MESGEQLDQNVGKEWSQIMAILIRKFPPKIEIPGLSHTEFAVSIGCFTTGIQFSWSSPFSLVIVQDKENYNITEADTELFMLFQPIGKLGCFRIVKQEQFVWGCRNDCDDNFCGSNERSDWQEKVPAAHCRSPHFDLGHQHCRDNKVGDLHSAFSCWIW